MRDRTYNTDTELARVILSAPEDSAERIRKSQKALREIKWIPAPLDWPCPSCGRLLERMTRILMPATAGAVRCRSCKYRSSTAFYLKSVGKDVVSTQHDKDDGT